MITLADGKQISMKCHWTGRAELVLGVPLLAVGLMLGFSRRRESQRVLGITATVLGVLAILLPTVLIGVCMQPRHAVCPDHEAGADLDGCAGHGRWHSRGGPVVHPARRGGVTRIRLVWSNIRGSLFRSAAILVCAALVAGLSLAATLVVRGAQAGLRQNLSRMGRIFWSSPGAPCPRSSMAPTWWHDHRALDAAGLHG